MHANLSDAEVTDKLKGLETEINERREMSDEESRNQLVELLKLHDQAYYRAKMQGVDGDTKTSAVALIRA
jgi:hypothetical protein